MREYNLVDFPGGDINASGPGTRAGNDARADTNSQHQGDTHLEQIRPVPKWHETNGSNPLATEQVKVVVRDAHTGAPHFKLLD
jgi:hypothetical protein